MTLDELKAIKERAEAATPGPWKLGGYTGADEIQAPAPPNAWDTDGPHCYVIIESDGGLYFRRDGARKDVADRTFIAAARSDVPALLAEVERLQKIEAAARVLVDRLQHVHRDKEYRAVWLVAQLHRGEYCGPSYAGEAHELLKALCGDVR